MEKTNNNKCSKREGEMEEGITVDNGYIQREATKWARGLKFLGWFLKNGKDIATFRCKNCGFLESYAK